MLPHIGWNIRLKAATKCSPSPQRGAVMLWGLLPCTLTSPANVRGFFIARAWAAVAPAEALVIRAEILVYQRAVGAMKIIGQNMVTALGASRSIIMQRAIAPAADRRQ